MRDDWIRLQRFGQLYNLEVVHARDPAAKYRALCEELDIPLAAPAPDADPFDALMAKAHRQQAARARNP